jgi:hypothetical protein
MTPRCPSDLALETYLFERTTSKYAPHVGGCATCQVRVAQMEREGQDFLQYVYPATVGKVEEAAAGRRTFWKRWMFVVPVPAAAAMAALLLVTQKPNEYEPLIPEQDLQQIKGGGALTIGLSVFLGATEGARTVADGEAIPASSPLRFKVTPTKACRLWVVSVDGTGQVSRLFPEAGDAAAIAKGGPLPGGAHLDGRGGPERFIAVCSAKPLPYDSVERAVKSAFRGEEAVRSTTRVPGLPDGTFQGTVLIEKKP